MLVLLADEIAVIALVFFVLWQVGVDLSPGIIAAVVILLGILVYVLFRFIAPTMKKKPATGREGMIGLEGRGVTPLTGDGLIRVHGELWKAYTPDNTGVAVDEVVIVTDVDGLRLRVRRKPDIGPE